MSQLCEHGYYPQRLGDGPCELCEDIAALKSQIAAALARAGAADLENRAWRALAEWERAPGQFRVVAVEDCDEGTFRLGACDGDAREVFGDGLSPQAAALDLAQKLGLLTTGAGAKEGLQQLDSAKQQQGERGDERQSDDEPTRRG